jgi:hypothetical protein
MTTKTLISGLDFGQVRDHAFLVTAEVTESPRGKRYDVRYLHRWALGTSYEIVVADVLTLYRRQPMAGTVLVPDITGVGRAPCDSLLGRGFNGRLSPINMSPGQNVSKGKGYLNVGKVNLITAINMVLGQDRLDVQETLPLADTFKRELLNYVIKQSEKGLETFENLDATVHDDSVVALALLLWHGDRHRMQTPLRTYPIIAKKKNEHRHIIVCRQEELAHLDRDQDVPALCVTITEKPDDPLKVPDGKLMCWHRMAFFDLQPDEVTQWTPAVQESLLSTEQAKALWKWLNQPDWSGAGRAWQCLVVVTDGGAEDRRGLSVAFAIADALRIDRSAVIQHGVEKDHAVLDEDASEPPNEHIYKTTKSARYAVIA